MSRAFLRLDNVTLTPPGHPPLLDDFSLRVDAGAVTTIMGPSGIGKSALLSFICGTLAPDFSAAGRVWIGDDDVTMLPPERRQIGILFQDDLLFPHLSVGDNLLFALNASVCDRRERRRRVHAALAEAGLAGTETRDPATLSGGQRARVALMRTLLSAPRVVLLDEPFSKLDGERREHFRQFVFAHVDSRRVPTLMVTHDPGDAAAAGGEVIDLGGRTR